MGCCGKDKKTREEIEQEAYEYDPNFDGIDKDRHCTDCLMLFIFIIFFALMLALFFYALTKSNYKYLYIPTDYHGEMCGYNNNDHVPAGYEDANETDKIELHDFTNKPYLFWYRPGKLGWARSACVSECPQIGYFTTTFTQKDPQPNNYDCGSYNKVPYTASVEDPYIEGPDRFYCPYVSTHYLQRCIPKLEAFDNIVGNDTQFNKYIGEVKESFDEISMISIVLQDLYKSYWIIAACVGVSLVFSIIWLLALRCMAGLLVWIIVFFTACLLGVLTWLCYRQSKNEFNNFATIEMYTFGFVSVDMSKKAFYIIFWILVAVDIIYVLLVIFLFKRILLSVKIIEIVARVFGNIPSLFIFPIILVIIMAVWWCYVIGVAIVLFGAGTPTYVPNADRGGTTIQFIEMKYDQTIQYMSIYHFVGFIWITWFISALGEMTVAGVFAHFYFTRKDERSCCPKCEIIKSFGRSLRYHIGSLATGSLIITIMTLIRLAIEYVDRKTKNTQSNIAKFVIKCMKCCFYCLDKFLKYLNRNCYILIAMHGYSFFPSCVRAFGLITRNCVRVCTINWVGDFTLFIGRVFISAGTCAISAWLFKEKVEVSFYIIPAIFVFLLSFFASKAFTGIFEMGIDSMFMCFMEDEERNDGSPGREKFAGKKMRHVAEVKDDERP